MTDKELLNVIDYSEKFSSISNPSWPAETFDPYSYSLFLTYASPEELEGNFCNVETWERIGEFTKIQPLYRRNDSF
jgi:hypothetical protein